MTRTPSKAALANKAHKRWMDALERLAYLTARRGIVDAQFGEKVEKATAERNEAQAEYDRLRAELGGTDDE